MKLTEDSVHFSLNHVQKFYDSDFFPRLLEYDTIFANRKKVTEYLTSTEFLKIPIKSPLMMPAPKPGGGYRIVHQLDPINTLQYTALAYLVATDVEKARPPIRKSIACSYRINVDINGNFFREGNGYNEYQEKLIKLSNSQKYVLLADITDFYNQIYIHRVQNAIEGCNHSLYEASVNIEKFLMGLNNGLSQGIPVGPAASIIMAEAVLLDIDQFLLSNDIDYTRYVDDFRIFSNSKDKLKFVEHDLTEYLYVAHRLTLSSSKTEIMTSRKFKKVEINNPQNMEEKSIHSQLEKLSLRVNIASDYTFYEPMDFNELPKEGKTYIQAKAFQNLLLSIVKRKSLDLGTARHILRRTRHLRSRAIYRLVLENFDKLAPVVRDVVLYLDGVSNDKIIIAYLKLYEQIVKKSFFFKTPYVSHWLNYLFSKRKIFSESDIIKKYLNDNSTLRYSAIKAKNQRHIWWMRNKKSKYSGCGDFEKRALIYCSSILPIAERKAWIYSIPRDSTDLLEQIMIDRVLSL